MPRQRRYGREHAKAERRTSQRLAKGLDLGYAKPASRAEPGERARRIRPSDFKRALGQFATGITVVTTLDRERQPLGLTVNAFSSVSLDPPLVLVCVDNRSETHDGFEATGLFGVSVLREDQEAFSRRFAVPGREKFAANDLHRGETGVALIPHALAHIECRVVASHPAGDHTIYVGEVVRLDTWPGRPLLYQASGYRRLERGAEPPK